MIVLVLYFLLSGVPVEQAIRSENGKDYDTFKSMADCEKQAKKDMDEFFKGYEDKVLLKCEKRG